jgi:hypothetical protein
MILAPLSLLLCLAAVPFKPAPPGQVTPYFPRPIVKKELTGKGLRELAILRNTIYARYGWDGYRKQWLRDYFHAQSWFKPNPDFHNADLSRLDHRNADTIGAYEASLDMNQLEAMQQAVLAKYHVSFHDLPHWKRADGSVIQACASPADAQPRGEDSPSRDCANAELYTLDPKMTVATLPLEARTELGLIQRAMGLYALDTDDHLADPKALDRLLQVADLRQLSERDLRILRNTIYARRGRPFASKELRHHFLRLGWYHPDPAYTEARLTPNDQRNIAMIKSVEAELGGQDPEDAQQRGKPVSEMYFGVA